MFSTFSTRRVGPRPIHARPALWNGAPHPKRGGAYRGPIAVTIVQMPNAAALAMGYHHLGDFYDLGVQRMGLAHTRASRVHGPSPPGSVAPAPGCSAPSAGNAGSPMVASAQKLGARSDAPLPMHGGNRGPRSQDRPSPDCQLARPSVEAHHGPGRCQGHTRVGYGAPGV